MAPKNAVGRFVLTLEHERVDAVKAIVLPNGQIVNTIDGILPEGKDKLATTEKRHIPNDPELFRRVIEK